MTQKYFNNIIGYDEEGFTRFIPDAARFDCWQAYLFAKEHGHPLNQHIRIQIPSNISQEGRKAAYRWFLNKFRVYPVRLGFMAVMILVRDCDPDTNDNPTIDVLMHVPEQHQSHFKKTVENWRCSPQVCTVDYIKFRSPDDVVRSTFNDLFSATSRQFSLNHPDLPHKASGEVMGQRTFYSRHLWTRKQIEFRRKKPAPF